ncbi:MAG: hypothetical protein PHH59_02280 [Methylovulum sp.]|uniref:hypothetical protein n=1 Tax=Methylovulum sp. TaxID=1916980 RepID=UPI002609610D|nr:hypothetical protein [Methylovulum sp.]MDD2722838.1 hypothetical protein [Methylovulum sp.]MDD5124400.1 hypothetical protein [Methylovulum sp.]
MNKDPVARWVLAHPLTPVHVDCAITVILKILDGKCKMRTAEKKVMEQLYDEVKSCPGVLFDTALHLLIEQARKHPDDAIKNLIYEKRLLAETAISRPVMKAFKAMIRQQGLLADALDEGEDAADPS